ncbi:NUDIX hydrolase domain-like protein [Armillaria nabsnona]|nr:NUDIX hydrolase domain-like protein [Armillaria nabsnona]
MSTTLPPGLHGEYEEHISGGDASEWEKFDKIRLYTNAFVVQGEKLLLGHKKRGFAKGMYNGFGGKVESGETSAEAALRELEEEAGVQAPLQHFAVLFFTLEGLESAFYIDIYRAADFSGDVVETDEMRPQWFRFPGSTADLPDIPLERMWQTDKHWMPLLLSNRQFVGRADYKIVDGETRPVKWWIGTTLGS